MRYPGYAALIVQGAVPPHSRPPQQPTQWQAGGTTNPPAVVRGAAPEGPPKYVLPRPEALGVATSLTVQPAAAPTPVQVDWTQIQARMERVGVVGYAKDRPEASVVRVTLTLATADPSRRQPVTAQGGTEAAAVLSALQIAEAWAQKR